MSYIPVVPINPTPTFLLKESELSLHELIKHFRHHCSTDGTQHERNYPVAPALNPASNRALCCLTSSYSEAVCVSYIPVIPITTTNIWCDPCLYLPERLELPERPKNNREILMDASANCGIFYRFMNLILIINGIFCL